MTLAPTNAEGVATVNAPDREAFRKRAQAWADAFREAYDQMREATGRRGAVSQCPLWHSHARVVQILKSRIERLERSLAGALAADALDDEQRRRIILALHGTTARDANLLSAADAGHLRDYRSLDEADRRLVRSLIARLAAAGGGQ